MTTYLTATQAATRLGKSEKTIRRWITEGRLLAHHPNGRKNMLAIAESDIEQLAQEEAQYQRPQAGEDQQATNVFVANMAARLATVEDSLRAAEQKIAALEAQLSVGTPAQPAAEHTTRTSPRRSSATTAAIEPLEHFPQGSTPHYIFAKNHGVNPRTFLDHIHKGDVPSIPRQKPNRKETAHWLTPEQQQAAIAFWTRNGTKFTRCSACPHDQDQQPASEDQPIQRDQVEGLPIGYVALRKFTDVHGIARNAVEPMRRAGFIAVERGKWKDEDGQQVTEALSPRGQRDLWVQFHSQDGFRPCDACPHLPASEDQQSAEAMI